MENNQSSRDRLKKKLKDKKERRTGSSSNSTLPGMSENTDIFSMISQVQSILKNNPEMVAKVSSCVNSLMSNPEVMNQLSSQIEQNIVQPPPSSGDSQTLQRSSSGESSEAVSKES